MYSDFWDDWLCFGRVTVSNIFTVVNALFGRDPKAKIGKNAPGTVSKNVILRKTNWWVHSGVLFRTHITILGFVCHVQQKLVFDIF